MGPAVLEFQKEKNNSTTSGQSQAYFLQANFPPKDVWLIFEYFQCLIFCVLTTPCCRVASGCFAPAFLAIQRNSNCLLCPNFQDLLDFMVEICSG